VTYFRHLLEKEDETYRDAIGLGEISKAHYSKKREKSAKGKNSGREKYKALGS